MMEFNPFIALIVLVILGRLVWSYFVKHRDPSMPNPNTSPDKGEWDWDMIKGDFNMERGDWVHHALVFGIGMAESVLSQRLADSGVEENVRDQIASEYQKIEDGLFSNVDLIGCQVCARASYVNAHPEIDRERQTLITELLERHNISKHQFLDFYLEYWRKMQSEWEQTELSNNPKEEH